MSLHTGVNVDEARAADRERKRAEAAAHQPPPPDPITTPEQGAALLGLTADQVHTAADGVPVEAVDRVLTDTAWVHQRRTTARNGMYGEQPATPAQHLAAVLDRARTQHHAHQRHTAQQAERDRRQTCPVTGQVDPTTRPRRLPWQSPRDTELRLSDRGLIAILAAAAEQVTPDELDRARGLLTQVLAGRAEPEHKKRRRR